MEGGGGGGEEGVGAGGRPVYEDLGKSPTVLYFPTLNCQMLTAIDKGSLSLSLFLPHYDGERFI